MKTHVQNFINYKGINMIIGEEGVFASIDGELFIFDTEKEAKDYIDERKIKDEH